MKHEILIPPQQPEPKSAPESSQHLAKGIAPSRLLSDSDDLL